MDFHPNAEQQALQEGIRAFCEEVFPLAGLGDLAEAKGLDRSAHLSLAELGVFQLRIPESEGGLGLGMADSVLVYAELGRRLVPGPLVFTGLAAGLIEGVAEGRVIVGGVDGPAGTGPHLIEHLGSVDRVLVVDEDRVGHAEAGDFAGTALPAPLDPLTPLYQVQELPAVTPLGDAALAARLRLEGLALSSALSLGIAEESLALALEHAKSREQFGRTIGSFQAIKHILADMFARLEHARAAVYAAGATLDHPEVGDPERAARGAKLLADEAARRNARASIQVHGGMGYTWETPAHYYFKRCAMLEAGFGDPETHADYLGERLDEGLPE